MPYFYFTNAMFLSGKLERWFSLSILIFLFSSSLIANSDCSDISMSTLYVNQAVPNSGSGFTWNTAYKELRDALDYAHANNQITEIWVAQGTYKPTDDLERLESFIMKNNLAIYGGFLGNETQLEQRDFVAHPTILSGDLAEDDDYSTVPALNNEENSYHVVFNYYNYLDETAILDGFHIMGGNARWDPPHHVGGGLYNKQASPAVYNCFFHGNRGGYGGGGIYIDSSALILHNSIIYDNEGVVRGGGIYCDASVFEVANCLFYNNKATRSDGTGGAFFNNFSNPTIINTTIVKNTAAFQGGGIINNAFSKPNIYNSIIWGNSDQVVNTSSFPNDYSPTSPITNNVVKIKNCLIQNSGGSGNSWNTFYGIDEGNNIQNNPEFVNFVANNFQLEECSPAINYGDNTLLPASIFLDLKEETRIFNSSNGGDIDLGTFEYQGIANCCNIGFPCDDNDGCTSGTTYQANCDCGGGVIQDADNDGICDTDIADNCEGPNVGDPCNDGNVSTFNDVVQNDCSCLGTSTNPNACVPQLNLSEGKIATQSSISPNGGDPNKAIDGNVDGDFWNGNSTSLTNWDNQTWWEVDLGEVFNIEQIDIYNRTDCCSDFLTDFHVLVSVLPFSSNNLNTILDQPGVGDFFQSEIAGSPSSLAINQQGRYVRIQIEGQGFLGLAEVQVLGCGEDNGTECPIAGTACNDGNSNTINDMEDGNCNCLGTPSGGDGGCDNFDNIAPTGTATQSSTQLNAIADRAIDGNTAGHFWDDASTSLTTWEQQGWWELDLGEIAAIESINIWARTECCSGFLNNYYVFISNTPFSSTDLDLTLAQSGVTALLQSEEAARPSMIPVDLAGRYIRIQLIGQAFLGIAEVEVMGCFGDGGNNCPPVGTTCDDGDSTTINDMEDGSCNCSGTPSSSGGCGSFDNIAPTGTATQSSIQLNAMARRAIDGNTAGHFWDDASTSLTNWEQQAWWELDLGGIATIESINIWARTECCSGFLNNYYVLISDSPFASTDLDLTLAQNGVTALLQSEEAARPSMIPVDLTGRYIRIQLVGQAFLGIAEVEVMGCFDDGGTSCPTLGTACDDGNPNTMNDVEDGFCNCSGVPSNSSNGCTTTSNIAFEKPTSQSSTLNAGGITGASSKAVDGNTNGFFFTSDPNISSVTATNLSVDPWWQVDLGNSYWVENIKVYNRTDGDDRTQDAYVLISNNPFTSSDLATARAQADFEFFIDGLVGSATEVPMDRMGRYVRVQMQGSGYLVLAEVEVEGCLNTNNLSSSNLRDFEVEKRTLESRINWLIDQQEEVDFYEIEKSINEVDFEFLEKINSDGLVGTRLYQISDYQPEYGNNFYRLKIVRQDGTFYYSQIRKVNYENELESIYLYPNPTNEVIHLTLGDFSGKKGKVEIFNTLGQKILEQKYPSIPSAPVYFEVRDFQEGIYSITIKIENKKRVTRKFVVVRK